MTLKALAAACGVSVGTVSKAFADSPEISEETKRKIFAFAKEHGVYDKYIKRRYEKKIVGVLCPEADSQLYSRELRLLCQFLRKRGAVMTVMFTDFDEERQKEAYIIESSYLNVDGIIVIGGGLSGAWPVFMPMLIEKMKMPFFGLADGHAFSRMETEVYNLMDPTDMIRFTERSGKMVKVPFSEQSVWYDPSKRVGVGITKLGTSSAVAMGAYAYAMQQLSL